MKAQEPWTVARVVGHLVELRVIQLITVEEVLRFSEAIQRTAGAVQDAVLLVDLRTPVVFAQPVAAAVTDLMTRANRVRRKTGILLDLDHAVFSMQLGRLVRQVGDPNRQTFTDPEDLLEWIGDVLTDPEKQRAAEFLKTNVKSSALAMGKHSFPAR